MRINFMLFLFYAREPRKLTSRADDFPVNGSRRRLAGVGWGKERRAAEFRRNKSGYGLKKNLSGSTVAALAA